MLVLSACGGDGGGGGSSGSGRGEDRRPLNDTGFVLCGDMANDEATRQNDIECADAGAGTEMPGIDANGDYVPAGQDALYGRDAHARKIPELESGFSFTHLDSKGNELPAGESGWACVRDNVTGYMWEIKTNTGGLRDRDWTYTWFNSAGDESGGNAGYPDSGEEIGSDNCLDKSRCDTEKYIRDVNALRLCGESDWRLPTANELKSIVHYGRFDPAHDPRHFPDVIAGMRFWTAGTDAEASTKAWYLDVYDGSEGVQGKNRSASVRLVNLEEARDVEYEVLGGNR